MRVVQRQGLTLVTGGTGYLGSHVVKALLARELPVRVLVRRTPCLTAGVDQVRGDLNDPGCMAAALSGVDVVVHVAGLATTARLKRAEFERVNTHAPCAWALAASAQGVRRFVHVGSVFSFGPGAGRILTEEDFDCGRTTSIAYQRSKREGVEELREASLGSMQLALVHPAALVGPGPSSQGNWFRDISIGLALRRFPVLPRPTGQRICLADVRDVAATIAAVSRGDRAGEWILGADNFPMARLLECAREELGALPPLLPGMLLGAFACCAEAPLRVLGRSLPASTDLLGVMREDWAYDSARAAVELGWKPRPVEPAIRRELIRARALKDGRPLPVELREA